MNRKGSRLAAIASRMSLSASPTEETDERVPSVGSVTAAVGGIVVAWIAAGSAVLLVRSLQHALAWLGFAVILAAAWPRRALRPAEFGWLIGAALGGVVLTASSIGVVNVAAVGLVLAAAAWTARDADQKALMSAAYAVAVLAIYRMAVDGIPCVWMTANALGEMTGRWTSAVSGKPLSIGATFAGLDFLVLMAALGAIWSSQTAPPRLLRSAYAAAAVCCGHAVYLWVLASSHDLTAVLPKAPPVEPSVYQSDLYVPPPWHWGDAVKTLLPWGVPWLALAVHALTAAAMLRWSRWRTEGQQAPAGRESFSTPAGSAPAPGHTAAATQKDLGGGLDSSGALGLGAAILAAVFAATTSFTMAQCDLSGRKVAIYEHGQLDWEKPKFDQYGREAAGQYGMLPTLLGSLGAQCARTADLASPAVAAADVLVVIHPAQPWSGEQIERVWDYVRRGGALLVVAEPRFQEDGAASSFNDLLQTIGVEVRFDTAIPTARHWQHGLETTVHPATAGIDDAYNGFALAESSSIRLGWQGRPILVGRWGWSDPGSDAVLTGVSRFDPGERLGDLVLAAEQRVGQGTVIVLADANPLKNLGIPSGYEFTGRLLGYLASRSSSPAAGWRQILGLLAGLGLLWLLARRACPERLAVSLVVIVLLWELSVNLTAARSRVLLDGRSATPNRVVCIDASHLNEASGVLWSDDGLAGLELTLMRNGYQPIVLRRWNDGQLQRAGMLISIGPARPFAETEHGDVRRFLQQGGVMLCMAGADRAAAIEPLLNEFGLGVPVSPLAANDPRAEPKPMGFFRTPYFDAGKYKTYVGLYAGWPVSAEGKGTEAVVRGFDERPVVAMAQVGQGRLYVFGDTSFAANKNLETDDGRAARGQVENAHFWRWFLGELNGPKWSPPEPKNEPDDDEGDDSEADSSEMSSDAGPSQPEGQSGRARKEAEP